MGCILAWVVRTLKPFSPLVVRCCLLSITLVLVYRSSSTCCNLCVWHALLPSVGQVKVLLWWSNPSPSTTTSSASAAVCVTRPSARANGVPTSGCARHASTVKTATAATKVSPFLANSATFLFVGEPPTTRGHPCAGVRYSLRFHRKVVIGICRPFRVLACPPPPSVGTATVRLARWWWFAWLGNW